MSSNYDDRSDSLKTHDSLSLTHLFLFHFFHFPSVSISFALCVRFSFVWFILHLVDFLFRCFFFFSYLYSCVSEHVILWMCWVQKVMFLPHRNDLALKHWNYCKSMQRKTHTHTSCAKWVIMYTRLFPTFTRWKFVFCALCQLFRGRYCVSFWLNAAAKHSMKNAEVEKRKKISCVPTPHTLIVNYDCSNRIIWAKIVCATS